MPSVCYYLYQAACGRAGRFWMPSPTTLEVTASLRRTSTGSKHRLKGWSCVPPWLINFSFWSLASFIPRTYKLHAVPFVPSSWPAPSTHAGSSKCCALSRNMAGKWDFLMLLNFLPSSSKTSGHCQVSLSLLTLWLLLGLLFWFFCSLLSPNSAAPQMQLGIWDDKPGEAEGIMSAWANIVLEGQRLRGWTK